MTSCVPASSGSSSFWIIRTQNAPICSVVRQVDPKDSSLCSLQTLKVFPDVFYHIWWYQKPWRCLVQDPHLTMTWRWGERCLPWETTQRWDQVTMTVLRPCTKFESKTDADSICFLHARLVVRGFPGSRRFGSAKLGLTMRRHSIWGRGQGLLGGSSWLQKERRPEGTGITSMWGNTRQIL